jgi:hypothetical protein
VIVFFVLSGFVIACASDERDRTLGQYALNRLSRLWSVSLPALVPGFVISPFVSPSFLTSEPSDDSLRTAANALFLGQSWFLDLTPPMNAPFWSLNYEAWFYAIFGAYMFLPRRTRTPITILLATRAEDLANAAVLAVGRLALLEHRSLAIVGKRSDGVHSARCFLGQVAKGAGLLAFPGCPLTDYPLAILVTMNFYDDHTCRWPGDKGHPGICLADTAGRLVHPDDLCIP